MRLRVHIYVLRADAVRLCSCTEIPFGWVVVPYWELPPDYYHGGWHDAGEVGRLWLRSSSLMMPRCGIRLERVYYLIRFSRCHLGHVPIFVVVLL